MATGKKAASAAGRQLRSRTETKAEKTVAGSDLEQTKGRSKKSGRKR